VSTEHIRVTEEWAAGGRPPAGDPSEHPLPLAARKLGECDVHDAPGDTNEHPHVLRVVQLQHAQGEAQGQGPEGGVLLHEGARHAVQV
jgi:hypothetical protein